MTGNGLFAACAWFSLGALFLCRELPAQCPSVEDLNLEITCGEFKNVNCTSEDCGGNNSSYATDEWVSAYYSAPRPKDCKRIVHDQQQCADHGPAGLEFSTVFKTLTCQEICPPPDGGGGENPECDPVARLTCEAGWDEASCSCGYSPILLGAKGNRIALTDAAAGVRFDLDGDGFSEQSAWTRAGSDEGFLALDRNRNGVIDDGIELFGNFTPQRDSSEANGFKALAEFDRAGAGGNGDGIISEADAVFKELRIWIDSNHDGSSVGDGLISLSEFGVRSISLQYRTSARRDRHGNEFRYMAPVFMEKRDGRGRVRKLAVDVFLVVIEEPE